MSALGALISSLGRQVDQGFQFHPRQMSAGEALIPSPLRGEATSLPSPLRGEVRWGCILRVILVAGILACLFPFSAFAAVLEAKEGVTPDSVATGELWSGDFLVMRLRRIGNSDPLSEVTQVKERLESLFERGLVPGEIKVRKLKKGGVLIVARGHTILTVTDAQARENDTTPGKLAVLWASNLRQALAEFSSFRLFPGSKTIPLGERFSFQLKGDFPGPFTITLSDPNIGEATFDEKTRTIVVESKKPGWSSLNVRSGDTNAVANVWVKQYAGVLPRSVLAEVTGNPADSELIREAVMACLRQSLSVRPMAYVQLPDEIWAPSSLPRGTSTALRVPVRIAGKDYIPVEEKVLVTVKNVILPREDTGYLMVSNRPETFLRSGVLLHEPIRDGIPVRLMFHHKNGVPGVDEYLQIKLVNRFTAPSKVYLTGGTGGPSGDEMQVGHLAASRYLDVLMADKGKIVTIPARSEYLVTLEKLAPERVISGILQFKVMEGALPEVMVEVREKELLGEKYYYRVDEPLNPAVMRAKGTFPSPDILLEERYQIGQEKYTFIPIGKKPYLMEIRTGEPNPGNYGVLYRIRLELTNPGYDEKSVRIIFFPTAGVARGAFVIDGKRVNAPITPPYEEVVLASYRLPPGSRRIVEILTTPEGGSYYPVNIIVKPE